jgi:hypothetical protein
MRIGHAKRVANRVGRPAPLPAASTFGHRGVRRAPLSVSAANLTLFSRLTA